MKRNLTIWTLFLSATVCLLWSPSSVHAQTTAKPVTIKYVLAFRGAEYLPLYAGRDKGFFQRENLDFDVYTLSTGGRRLKVFDKQQLLVLPPWQK